ncbi:SWIM zinc finger family protein [Serratia fonticola]|uniref:SWIM zinc finger family protein n=1 Tax=Serratia fonticola TaxID=47917 RepID=UPI002DB772CD|nr:SWIM zinc finger family protein [Serratia fonticola]MEB7885449.1 SWIM zinc finger family protein [Serratia fonticola]
MTQRSDLLELTPEALMALSNAGFVKRAQKEVAEGKQPELTERDDGCIDARFGDGNQVTFPPGKTLRDATCSCPASSMCRHRVTLVLAYQALHATGLPPEAGDAQPQGSAPAWSPARFSEQLRDVPLSVISRAKKLIQGSVVVQLSKGSGAQATPSARLPMCDVRFFSRSSLAHARCDCIQETICEHIVMAVWGFEQAEISQPDFEQLTLQIRLPDGEQAQANALFDQSEAVLLQTSLDKLLLKLWSDGSSQPERAIKPLMAQVGRHAQQLQWRWISESLADIQQGMADQHNRSSRYHPVEFLQRISGLSARLVAARCMDQQAQQQSLPRLPAAEILGLGVKGEIQLEHLKLVSLGARYWADEQQEGVDLIYTDPDSQALMVIERQWPKNSAPQGVATPIGSRRIAGHPVKKLAACQVITNAAKRRANGALDIASGKQYTSVLPLSARAWELLGEPLRQPDAAALKRHLQQALPDFVRPRQPIEQLHILPVSEVLDWCWDPALQCLQIDIFSGEDRDDNFVTVSLNYDGATPHATEVLARAMLTPATPPRLISGRVKIESGKLFIEPLAVASDTQIFSLCADEAEPFPMERQADLQQRSGMQQALADTETFLAQWLQQGIRHQGERGIERVKSLAEALNGYGLMQLSAGLNELPERIRSNNHTELVHRLMTIYQTLRLVKDRQSH